MTDTSSEHRLSVTRRDFIAGTAGLTFTFGLRGLGLVSGSQATDAGLWPNWWLTIATDGTVTIMSPAAEMGQGSFTALPAIIAEELDADWAKVKIDAVSPWTRKKYGNPWYNGSLSYTQARQCAPITSRCASPAHRRAECSSMLSPRNGASRSRELSTEPSIVIHASSGRRISYGEMATFAQAPAELPKIEEKDLKPTEPLPAHRCRPPAGRGAAQGTRHCQVRNRRAPARHDLWRAAAIALMRAARPPRSTMRKARQVLGHSRRGEAAQRRRCPRHQRRGDAGGQERPLGHLDRRSGRLIRQREIPRGVRRGRPRQGKAWR